MSAARFQGDVNAFSRCHLDTHSWRTTSMINITAFRSLVTCCLDRVGRAGKSSIT